MASGTQPTIMELQPSHEFPTSCRSPVLLLPPLISSLSIVWEMEYRSLLSRYVGSIAVCLFAAHHEQRTPNPSAGLF